MAKRYNSAFSTQFTLSTVFVTIGRPGPQNSLRQDWVFHDPLSFLRAQWNDALPLHPRRGLLLNGGQVLLHLCGRKAENLSPWDFSVKLLSFLPGESLVWRYGFGKLPIDCSRCVVVSALV